jgi:hypothetical protein
MSEWQETTDSKFEADAGFLCNNDSVTAAVLRVLIKIMINPRALDITNIVL